jgi:hypothetical protein
MNIRPSWQLLLHKLRKSEPKKLFFSPKRVITQMESGFEVKHLRPSQSLLQCRTAASEAFDNIVLYATLAIIMLQCQLRTEQVYF